VVRKTSDKSEPDQLKPDPLILPIYVPNPKASVPPFLQDATRYDGAPVRDFDIAATGVAWRLVSPEKPPRARSGENVPVVRS
jgi:hypothetical protein